MKKFSFLILSILLMGIGVLLSACAPSGGQKINLDKTSATIYLGETENNTVTINASLVNVDVKYLDLVYEPSNLVNISQVKNSNGTFTLTITSNAEKNVDPVAVEVKAGKYASATFYVEVVLPVKQILQKENVYLAYNGKATSYNLYDFISFEPSETKQKNVNFTLLTENDKLKIEGNTLTIGEGVDIDKIENIEINAVSSAEGKANVSCNLNLKLVPNVKLLANKFDVKANYNNSESTINQNGYTLTLSKKDGKYTIQEFSITIIIPRDLGIDVDIDVSGGGYGTSILNYLSCSKSHTTTTENDVYTFLFDAISSIQGTADLKFKYFYKNELYKKDTSLSSVFVCAEGDKAENQEIDKISVTVTIPVAEIDVDTNAEKTTEENYIVYNNYATGVLGEKFKFLAKSGDGDVIQKTLILEKPNNSNLTIFDKTGKALTFKEIKNDKDEIISYEAEIQSGAEIFVKGENVNTNQETLTVYSKDDKTKKAEIKIVVNQGISALGFVESTDDSSSINKNVVLYANRGGAELTWYIYAPNANASDLKGYQEKNTTPPLTIKGVSEGGSVVKNYFLVSFPVGEIGEFNYIIESVNGYQIKATVIVTEKLENVSIDFKDNASYVSGIGEYKFDEGSLINLSIQNGYIVELDYIANANAKISDVKYSFYEPQVGVYEGNYISLLKSLKNTAGNGLGEGDFNKTFSSYINTQSLAEKLISAEKSGVMVIKIDFYDQKIENGKITGKNEPITKYLFVQVYDAVKEITSDAKNITLRAENQLSESAKSLSQKTISFDVLSNALKSATYNKLFIDGGKIEKIANTEQTICTYTKKDNNITLFEATYNFATGELTVNAKYVDSLYAGNYQIELFAGDFVDFGTGTTIYSGRVNYPVVKYILNIDLIETKSIEEINVTNLNLTNEDDTTKTYETIYIDTSKNSLNQFRLKTEITPFNAFEKELEYVYSSSYGMAVVDISNDGLITVVGEVGGKGIITIAPKHTNNSVKLVIIPIVIADGNSYETAYEITSLSEITNPNKHYVLTIPTTYETNSTLFETFNGGLYGKKFGDTTSSYATIKLNGESLFGVLGENSHIAYLNICGDVTSKEKNIGFVASENKGTIEHINVTTYIKNGVYVPSLLTVTTTETSANIGGIVGLNSGTITNSTFAGSINLSATNLNTAYAIAQNSTGTVANCKVIIAKFADSVGKDRVVEITDQTTTTATTYYTNGIIKNTASTNEFKDAKTSPTTSTDVTREDFKKATSLSNIKIAKADNGYIGTIHSFGDEDYKNRGIVFFYSSKDQSKQTKLDKLNTISYADVKDKNITDKGLFDLNGIDAKTLKVIALNPDGSVCNFVQVNSDSITLYGTGEFTLKITSIYDYTISIELKMVSMYFSNDFTVTYNGTTLSKSYTFELVKNQKAEIVSKINNRITLSGGEIVELQENDFDISFKLQDKDKNDVSNDYITNTKLGVHTINMLKGFPEDGLSVNLSLLSKYTNFNDLINKYFGVKTFSIQQKQGTTKIEADISEGSIEPKDTLTINAKIFTDLYTDIINKDSIQILSSANMDVTKYFNIAVNGLGNTNFEILISVNLENNNLLNLVNKTYTVIIKAQNKGGKVTYDAFASVKLNLLPQTIANINTTLYGVSSATVSGISVSAVEPATSVLMPTDSGLFVVDMFPSYASFDYLEVVATSSTLTKLNFRLQKLNANAKTYTNASMYDDNNNKTYEAIENKNGIRIFALGGSDTQNIGVYYLKVFADATFDADTIFTITVSAFYGGEELTAKSVFKLYVKAPENPQLSLDGKTRVYAKIGEKVENIIATIADDQVNFNAYIATDEQGNSVLDNKPTAGLSVSFNLLSDNSLYGYRRYNISIDFGEQYVYGTNSTKIKLVVTSKKISHGNEIPVSSEMYIFFVEHMMEEDDFVISNSSEHTLNVTSIKETELNLAELVINKDDKGNVIDNSLIQAFKNGFNKNYYYTSKETDFVLGSNVYKGVKLKMKAEVLASYLYYVNGTTEISLLSVNNGKVQINEDDFLSKYLIFDLQNDKLKVKGGTYTGTINMILRINYKMPDGKSFDYVYKFDIVNSIYTTEDLPKEIANVDAFKNIQNEELAQDYILTNDLYLYDYETIPDTSKINSLDGNNHTIHIINYASNITNFALFEQVSSGTTIKNLTVNLYYLKQITTESDITDINVAGFAVQNDGTIYNCEILAYKDSKLATTVNTYGLKLDENIVANVAGFVINNNGSITNSRVGGESKLVTEISYTQDNTGYSLNKNTVSTQMLNIRASGTISGFVINNTGVISSSFVKKVTIQNTYKKQETLVTTGFVNTNGGTITMSYVEGDFLNANSVQSDVGGMEGLGIMSGFVYKNNAKISDSYTNILITNSREQVGRLGAGFVYENSSSATIERCYSASKIVSNNITQMNFAGITDEGKYNNAGQIKTSYYYAKNSGDELSIETMLSTSITAVTEVEKDRNFYGFNFDTTSKAGTWTMTSKGPKPVSPDEIAHSVRAKTLNTTGQNTDIEYLFIYCDGFELGTIKNPIIIRSATEFNSVFGASNSTDIKDNYNLKTNKVYGTYRIINDLDMKELVPKSEQETEYKVNLLSTQMTLTGEYSVSSNKAGSLQGNGLTIKNLAISNSSATTSEFGLFKSLENGATICNLNIELASGGVSADHTTFVGTIAGTLENSNAYNLKISTLTSTAYTKVIGANVSGGAFGRVIGKSNVANISLENVSVTSTYNENVSTTDKKIKNEYPRTVVYNSDYNKISISGGAFGVVDYYDTLSSKTDEKVTDFLNATVLSIYVSGGAIIEGMTAGGVAGFVGDLVVARDLSFTVLKDAIKPQIIAYNCYAGGIVGFNKGYLYQLKAEHEQEWQTEIESNMQNYYKANGENRESIDRGSLDIFNSDLNYSEIAVGGLVGASYGGKLSIGYSKINVISNNAKNIGGVVGYVYNINNGTLAQGSEGFVEPLKLNEIYATGDVYSNAEGAFIGGIIGNNGHYVDKSGSNPAIGTTLTKVTAMNYWGHDAYTKFGKKDANINAIIGGGSYVTLEDNDSTVVSLKSIQFEGEEAKEICTSASVFNSYYSYTGVASDNGAQIDLMFKEKGWYNDHNWTRDLNETFPHIVYVLPTSNYIIETKADFYKFILYGRDADATFIIKGTDKDPIIDCTGWNQTIGLIRGSIVGATDKNGFKNLKTPLFAQSISNKISNLTFEDCSAPLVKKANAVTFSGLIYKDCEISSYYENSAGIVASKVEDDCKFEGISFNDGCKINAKTSNIGFLFGSHTGTGVTISNVEIKNTKTTTGAYSFGNGKTDKQNLEAEVNYGLIFGSANEAEVSGISIYDNLKVAVGGKPNASSSINAGLVCGQVTGVLSLSDIKINKIRDTKFEFDGEKLNNPENQSISLYIGGLAGNVGGTFTISGNGTSTSNSNAKPLYICPTINVKNIDSTTDSNSEIINRVTNFYLGTACGSAGKIKASNGLIVFGLQDPTSSTDNSGYKFEKLEISSIASSVNAIGGVAGQVASSSGDNGYLSYYGDIVFSAGILQSYVYIGGVFGNVEIQNASSEIQSNISNAIFEGTVSFDEGTDSNNKNTAFKDSIDKITYENGKVKTDSPQFTQLSVGGIIGHIGKGISTGVTISNSIASGELSLPSKSVSSSLNFAGVVGFAESSVKFETNTDTNTQEIKDQVISLTTVFSTSQSDFVDALIRCSSTGDVTASGTPVYCSSLNLAVSNNRTFDTCNKSFNDITIPEVLKQVAPKGSKINAYKLNEVPKTDSTSENTYSYTEENQIRTYSSTYLRKLYIDLGDSNSADIELGTDDYNYQISLKNTILFSSGAVIYSNYTPFYQIDSKSAVTGVVAKIYIDDSLDSNTINLSDDDNIKASKQPILNGKNYTNYAGFVNLNEGIVYTCSTQETMNKYSSTTQFHAYFNKTNYITSITDTNNPLSALYGSGKNGGVAGFVALNKGYIFGSNTNIKISSSKTSAHGFVALNQGTISYCYASGINCSEYQNAEVVDAYKKSSNGTITKDSYKGKLNSLFAESTNEGKFDNCYTIVMAKCDTKFLNTTLPSGVVGENDACEVNLTGGKTLYDSADNALTPNSNAKQFYATDSKFNYNYPTISGGPFESFTFTKRSTMVQVGDNGGYTELAKTANYQENDYKQTLYCQIPNLTVFSQLSTLTSQHSKFVLINNINVCYNNTALTSAKFDSITPGVTDFSEDLDKKFKNLTIDGYNNGLYNILLNGANLIKEISKSSTNSIPVTIKNLKFGSTIKLTNSTGIIGTIGDGVTLDNITFEEITEENLATTTPTSSTTGNIKPDNYFAVIIKNVKNAKIGILAGQNSGTITNSNFNLDIKATGSSASYTLGGFVGENSGTVKNSTFTAKVLIDETGNNPIDVTFGAFVGENSGTLTNLTLEEASKNNALILTEGGSVLLPAYDDNVNITAYRTGETEKKDSTKYTDPTLDQYTAQIFVRTNNKAIVGGIAGTLSSGKISECTILAQTSLAEDSKYITIFVGDEQYQMIAYAGGIVGTVTSETDTSGTILDCANVADITAMSVWQATTNKTTTDEQGNTTKNANFEIDGTGLATRISSNYQGKVYYEDAKNSTSLKMNIKYECEELREYKVTFNSMIYDGMAYIPSTESGANILSLTSTNTSTNTSKEFSFEYDNNNTIKFLIGLDKYDQWTAELKCTVTINSNDSSKNDKKEYNYDCLAKIKSGEDAKCYDFVQKEADDIYIIDGITYYWKDRSFLVYREMTSLAFAGGIAGYGIKSVATENNSTTDNARLANYGEINAGYRGIKQVAKISAKNIQSLAKKGNIKVTKAAFVGVFGQLIFLSRAKSLYREGINTLKDIFQANVKINLSVVIGNSSNYWTSNQSIYNIFDGKDSLRSSLDKILLPGNQYSARFGQFFGGQKHVRNAYDNLTNHQDAPLRKLTGGLGVKFPINFSNATFNLTTKLITLTTEEITNNASNDWFTLKSYNSDGICPSKYDEELGENETLQTYTPTDNVKGNPGSYSAKTGNPENSKLQYKDKPTMNYISEKGKNGATNPASDWTIGGTEKNEDAWTKVGNYYIPNKLDDWKLTPGTVVGNDVIVKNTTDNSYSITITKLETWKKLAYTLNYWEDVQGITREDLLKISVTIDLGNNQTIINVGTDTLHEFNGKINVINGTFKNLIVFNSSNTQAGFIGKTTGCTLNNLSFTGDITYKGANVTDENDNIVGLNFGTIIGEVNGETIISNLKVLPNSVTLNDNAISNMKNFGLVVGNASSKLTITNLTLGNTNNPFELHKTNSATSYISNSNFGGVVAEVSNEVNLEGISTYGEVKLVSGFTNAGGIVGNVESGGSLKLEDYTQTITTSGGEETQTTSNYADLSVIIASNSILYVGGIAGANAGSITISNNLYIGTKKAIKISADVTNSEKEAYAGGLVGNNSGTVKLDGTPSSSITFGLKDSGSYSSISYILAGYNQFADNGIIVYAAKAFAGKYFGNSTDTISKNTNFYSTMARYLNINSDWSASTSTTSSTINYATWDTFDEFNNVKVISDNNGTSISFDSTGTQLFKLGTAIENGDANTKIYVEDKTYDKVKTTYTDEQGKEQTSTISYTYALGTRNAESGAFEQDSSNAAITLDTETAEGENEGDNITSIYRQSLSYKVTEYDLTNKFDSSKITGQIAKQWLLEINYSCYSEMYAQTLEDTEDTNLTYKYKITLTSLDSAVNPNGKYLLQVIQLNNYTENTNITYTDKAVQVITKKNDDETEISNKTVDIGSVPSNPNNLYVEDPDYNTTLVNKIVSASETIDLSEDIEVEALRSTYELDFKQTEKGSEDNKYYETTSISISATYTPQFKIEIKSNEFVFDENAKIEVSSSVNTSYYKIVEKTENDKTTREIVPVKADGSEYSENEEISESTALAPINTTYTHAIISYDLPTNMSSDSVSSTQINNASSVNIYVNPAKDAKGNITSSPTQTEDFTQDITIGGENGINLEFKQNEFMFNKKEFAYAHVYKCTFDGKDYLIVSLADTNYNITEYVYLIDGGNLYSCGNIKYTLKDYQIAGEGTYAKDAFDKIFTETGPARYESFFPKTEKYENNICNMEDNLTSPYRLDESRNYVLDDEKKIVGTEGLTLTRAYYNATVEINANVVDVYYTYTTTYTKYTETYTITASTITKDEPTVAKDNSGNTITETDKVVYLTSENALELEKKEGETKTKHLITAEITIDSDYTKITRYKEGSETEETEEYKALPQDLKDKIGENDVVYKLTSGTPANITGYKVETSINGSTTNTVYYLYDKSENTLTSSSVFYKITAITTGNNYSFVIK